MGAHVSLERISKRYGEAVAVDDVSLDIAEHEFVTLLGPSGSGKTTTLMVVAGFVRADKGRVLIGGKDVTEIAPYRRNIGMVFQNYALFPHMTVYDNIAYPLKMRRVPRAKARQMVEEILEVVQLRGLGFRRPAQLSGGQQQRVALARALVFQPPILLMDEPLGALDKKLREHMQLELKHIQEKLGITILYVTHDQEEALTMSTRIAVMKDGRIEQIGTALAVYDRPTNEFVADFVGETNFFEAEILGVEEGAVYVSGPCVRRIRANAARRFEPGQRVHLAVRPEKVMFVEEGVRGICSYEGTVVDTIFLGDITKYYVRLSHVTHDRREGVIVMKVQNRLGSVRHGRGDHVRIGWNEMDGTVV
ncbi:MAG: ABC transporter ATP-binding protein [Deltaproteobacteria bacterium]|nr:ABC transporter ATP-binding protein [Deltaproteobacteria bacterium]